MNTYTTPTQRRKLIDGLRDLADFLSDHAEIPAPHFAEVTVFPPTATDAAMRADIDVIAAMLDRGTNEYHGHYFTSRQFGPVAYRAVAISTERTARYVAWESYRNAVTPDPPTPSNSPDGEVR